MFRNKQNLKTPIVFESIPRLLNKLSQAISPLNFESLL